jgi:RNA polymerase sigma-70 factor (ECF subfamily)
MAEEDRSLVEKAQKGDTEAFGALYDRHTERIYRFIFLKTGHRNDAEDLLHEVFLSAWRTLGGYETRSGVPVTSWLYRIAGNRVIDWYRTRKGDTSLDEMTEMNAIPVELASAGHAGLLEALDRGLALEGVLKAVRTLNDTEQTVVLMRYVEDLSPEETASAIGKTPGAVRLIQHRAIAKLKKYYAEINETAERLA